MPHIHELFDFVVSFYIVHNERVLLVNHPRYDKWISFGGHVELDEDPEQALYREIAEETGMTVRILSDKPEVRAGHQRYLLTPNLMDVHEANPPHSHIGLIYFAVSDTSEYTLSDEHQEAHWFSSEDLRNPKYGLSPDVIYNAEAALAAAKLDK